MSVFVQQNNSICGFNTSNSWIVLSPIEQGIKRKIETVGVPLKDWDIQINYGIKTGYNEAFIISGTKREEILTNCQTDDERQRTAELIRPILRGRDIKKFGYNFADLWLINTHNGIKGKIPRIDINEYPTIKAYLNLFLDKIKNRSDQGDTPYNLRNCAYMEDFFKPKIVFQEMVQESSFAYDKDVHFFCLDTGRIITGKHLKYLAAILNSNLFFFSIKRFYGGGSLGETGVRMKHVFFEKFPCIITNDKTQNMLESFVDCIVLNKKYEFEEIINRKVYELYGLSQKEIDFIDSQQ